MKQNEKTIFALLCIIMWAVNGYISMAESKPFSINTFIGGGLGGSIVSIPLWAGIGVVLANLGLFFRNIIKPTEKQTLNIWHKANIGLTVGIIMKVLFPTKVP